MKMLRNVGVLSSLEISMTNVGYLVSPYLSVYTLFMEYYTSYDKIAQEEHNVLRKLDPFRKYMWRELQRKCKNK